ncbi:MAG: hypothetical protein IJM88_02020 [Bacteroidales bacterium]|nr:hypothetical protein [Bacteroidales bacterium]
MAKKRNLLGNGNDYKWTFANIGGVTRVTINSGEDIAHLGELDQKLWTVLSCPVKGLEFDEQTLALLDTDADGKIRVNEVVDAAKWLTSVLKNSDRLLEGNDFVALADLNGDTEAGAAVVAAMQRLFADKEVVALADVAAAREAFDEKVKAREDATAATVDSRPYGDRTDAVIDAVNALKDKVSDYFMRCKLIAFNEACSEAVDVSVEKIQSLSEHNMAACADQIAAYPLARPNKEALLHLDDGINPAWQATFNTVRTGALAVDYPEAAAIDEQQWQGVVAKLDAYTASLADDKSAKIESFDKALADEDADIKLINKLLLLMRDFYKLLKNYVVFADFYTRDAAKLAVFQCGRLYIDQRCLDLCIKVSDMGKQAESATFSGLYLLYCHCVSKTKAAEMDIVAALTDGDIEDLRVGKNAVFYDRSGQDWDATVTKIVDNPISVRQAFWAPYKKLWKFITDKINKNAAEKEAKQMDNLTAKADTATNNIGTAPAADAAAAPADAAAKKTPFDIAKFAGIFAAIGLALGALGAALAGLGSFLFAKWYNIILLLLVIVVVVSGPSMFIAWTKLRRRNLGPVLNANGWAINAQVRINTAFGATLTSLAKYPMVKLPDPYADKKMAWWKKCLIWLVVLGGIFCALYFTNTLKYVGLPFKKEPPAVVEPIDPILPDEAPAEAPVAEAPVAEAPVAE